LHTQGKVIKEFQQMLNPFRRDRFKVRHGPYHRFRVDGEGCFFTPVSRNILPYYLYSYLLIGDKLYYLPSRVVMFMFWHSIEIRTMG
jgi:hypothetical protein